MKTISQHSFLYILSVHQHFTKVVKNFPQLLLWPSKAVDYPLKNYDFVTNFLSSIKRAITWSCCLLVHVCSARQAFPWYQQSVRTRGIVTIHKPPWSALSQMIDISGWKTGHQDLTIQSLRCSFPIFDPCILPCYFWPFYSQNTERKFSS